MAKLSVTFDLWDTLLNDQAGYEIERREIRCSGMMNALASFGIKVSPVRLREAYDSSVTWMQTTWWTHKEISTRDQARRIATEATGTLPNENELIEMLEDAYVRPVLVIPPTLSSEAVETLEGIRARSLKLGLICNIGRSSGKILRELLADFHVLDFFHATVFSDEIGVRKPDKRIFEAAANRLGVDVSTIVHIGYHPEADVWGAKRAGMLALLLELSPELYKGRDLATLWRSTRKIDDSEIRPDARITSLKESLRFLDRSNL